jgi:hypothetical protein
MDDPTSFITPVSLSRLLRYRALARRLGSSIKPTRPSIPISNSGGGGAAWVLSSALNRAS